MAVDIWALGILCFELVAGYSPFSNPTDPENSVRCAEGRTVSYGPLYERIGAFDGKIACKEEDAENSRLNGFMRDVGEGSFKDFIEFILRPNPAERPTISQVLKHQWISSSN